jgi:hypothetical protein
VCSENDRASTDRRREREGNKPLALTSTALTPVPNKRQVVKDVVMFKVDSKIHKMVHDAATEKKKRSVAS